MKRYNNGFSMEDIHRLNYENPDIERYTHKYREIILGNVFYYYINLN
jgi:hypothetical protein